MTIDLPTAAAPVVTIRADHLTIVVDSADRVRGGLPHALSAGAGRDVRPCHCRRRGSLATIGRSRTVAQPGRRHLTDHLAWLLGCTVHIWFLAGFRNRLVVGSIKLRRCIIFNPAARLISRHEPPIP